MMRRNFLAALIAGAAAILGGKAQKGRATTGQLGGDAQDSSSTELVEMRQKLRAALPYECVTVAGGDALSEWKRLHDLGQGWPVIIGDDEALDRIAEQYSLDDPAMLPPSAHPSASLPKTAAEIIVAADGVNVPAALRQFWQDEYGDDEEADAMPAEGSWPSSTSNAQPGFTIASDVLTGKAFPRVHILLIPTPHSYEVPAYLRWGNWNACPSPEIHVAALRYWHHRYGAELIGLNGDTINMRASRRPSTKAEALNLARDQFYYCADIVYQGTETLAPLAAGLMDSDWWFFWWD